MSTTDSHVTMANHHLSRANRRDPVTGRRNPDDDIEATIALTQATLALVEEQRTANLMSLFMHIEHQGDMPDHARELFSDIAMRLGLRGESR